jgi:hypothetical protein
LSGTGTSEEALVSGAPYAMRRARSLAKQFPRVAEAFADSLDKKFPVHTKAAAYLSYAYFLKQADSMDPKSFTRCTLGFQHAADYWDLHNEFSAINNAFTGTEKSAAEPAPSKYALSVGAEQFFPVNGPSEIIKSADELVQHRSSFDYTLRSTAAKNIMKAAADAGLPWSVIPEPVHKMAGCGLTTKKAALIELTSRWNAERRPSLAQPLYDCIEKITGLETDILGGTVCEKLATVIDVYDRFTGKPSEPETVLFAFTKHAAEKAARGIVTMIDGTIYQLENLEKAADAFSVLGKDVLTGIKNVDGSLNMLKVADLIDTLPRMDADVLKTALNAAGVAPCSTTKLAMVAKAVSAVQNPGLTTVHTLPEKRADILARLEAEDPLVKRAMDVIRKTKEAAAPVAKTPKGIGGLFIRKAPNSTTVSVK